MMEPIPVKPQELVLYLQYLSEEYKSKAAVQDVHNAIALSASLTLPSADPFMRKLH